MSGERTVLFLSNKEIEQLVDAKTCIDCLEEAYREMAYGRAINQLRMDTEVPLQNEDLVDGRYEFKTMVGIVPKLNVVALRIISVVHSYPTLYGQRRDDVIPLALGKGFVGLIMLLDLSTTEPIAILQDGYIRNLRVAGTSGVAAKYLAREDSETLGIIGSGWMARAHAEAMAAVRKIKRVMIYSPNLEHRIKCAQDISQKLGIEARAVDEPEEAVAKADIVVTATSAKEPVLMGKWLKAGSFFSSVKAMEIDATAIERAQLVVLHARRTFETHIMGEGQFGTVTQGEYGAGRFGWEKHLAGRIDLEKAPLLEEVVTGKVRGRSSREQIIFFNNVPGLGIQFAAAGAKAYERARHRGLGKEVPTEWFVQEMRTG